MRYALAFSLSLFGTSLLNTTTAFADRFDLENHIDSVIVYPSGASLTRNAAFDIPAGTHFLRFTGISQALLPQSLRVDGSSDTALTIRSVTTEILPLAQTNDGAATSELSALEEEIFQYNAALRAQNAIIEAARRSLQRIASNGNGLPDGERLTQLATLMAQSEVEARELRNTITALESEKAELEAEYPGLNREATQRVAVIEVHANEASTGQLQLHYQLQPFAASWSPFYDAQLIESVSEDKPDEIILTRRATIEQRTEQDWQNVHLQLSTARPSAMIAPPPAYARLLDLADLSLLSQKMPIEINMAMRMQADAMPMAIAATPEMTEATTQDGAVTFTVPNRTTIHMNGKPRQITLSETSISAGLALKAYPELDEKAYYIAEFTAPDTAPLLRGSVNLQRGNRYVGTHNIPFIAAGEKTSLPFGPEDGIVITHRLQTQRAGDRGVIRRVNQEETAYDIEVNNFTDENLPIEVYARLPIALHDDIELRLETTPQAAQTTENQPRGVVVWVLDLAAKGNETLSYGWSARWPEDEELIETIGE